MVVVTKQSTIDSVPRSEYVPTADHRVRMSLVSWDRFESFLELRGDVAGPRVTYLKGTLELMSPSRDHERIKKRLACIIEAYLSRLDIPWEGAGSWMLQNALAEAGLEPDECYLLNDTSQQRPDLALEVVWTSGGIDKLEVYRRLGVPEVWFWKEDVLRFFVLRDSEYTERSQSHFIPSFDKQLAYYLLALGTLRDVQRALAERLR